MDNRRLIPLVVFVLSLYMLWMEWQRYNQPPVPAQAQTQAAGTSAPQPTVALANPADPNAAPAPAAQPATQAETVTIRTDVLVAEISTLGGDLVRLELLKHRENVDPKANLVLLDPAHRYAAQTGLIGTGLPTHRTVFRLQPGPRELAAGATDLQLRLEADGPDGLRVTKTYTFKAGSYEIGVAHELANTGTNPLPASHAYFQFQRDGKAPAGESSMVSTFTGPAIYTDAGKYQKVAFDDVADNSAKFTNQAKDGWLAMVQHYFVAAWLPQGNADREFYLRKLDGDLFAAGVILPLPAVAPGTATRVELPLYAGPQEQSRLKALAPGFDLVVDYGWLTVIAAPLFWALSLIHGLVGNWGWAIVVLTVLIKLVFFPLSAASYKSMARMRQVTPRLMALKERYADDRQKMNQEMMELYRKEKINPLGGCLPIVIQIPVFIALYWVLLGAVEMRGAPWMLWIHDLSAEDPFYILPVLMVISMFIQTKLNPTPPDPIQAKVMLAMPFVFGAMFFFFPAGLVLYWVVNNILSIAQQWQITRMIESGGAAAAK